MWLTFSIQVVTVLLLVLNVCTYFENYIPPSILRTVRYGKAGIQSQAKPFLFEVPHKRYVHINFFALPLVMFVLYFYFYNVDLLMVLLRIGLGSEPCLHDKASLIVLILLALQILRRTYEIFYVAKSCESGRVNVIIYLMGFWFYFGAILSVFGGSWGYIAFDPVHACVGILIFFYAWFKQYEANCILGALRATPGDESYHIPRGGLFEYVSCANYLTEWLMYFGTCIIFGLQNYEYNWVVLRVFISQVYIAGMSHKWYLKKFGEEYPKDRKRLIPLIF